MASEIDEALLSEWTRLASEATPGPWDWTDDTLLAGVPVLSPDGYHRDDDIIDAQVKPDVWRWRRAIIRTDSGVYPPRSNDRDFIAAAREAVPSLIAAHREQAAAHAKTAKQLVDITSYADTMELRLREAEAERDAARAQLAACRAALRQVIWALRDAQRFMHSTEYWKKRAPLGEQILARAAALLDRDTTGGAR